MRRLLLAVLMVPLVLALAGCPKRPVCLECQFDAEGKLLLPDAMKPKAKKLEVKKEEPPAVVEKPKAGATEVAPQKAAKKEPKGNGGVVKPKLEKKGKKGVRTAPKPDPNANDAAIERARASKVPEQPPVQTRGGMPSWLFWLAVVTVAGLGAFFITRVVRQAMGHRRPS